MIDLGDYSIFAENKAPLKETSLDDSQPSEKRYMVEADFEAVDFDSVKRRYANKLGLSEETAASVDAVIPCGDGFAFIEFKNGKVNNRNIKDKARDSLLIFLDIINRNLSFSRENLELIVVYNAEKNPLPNQLAKNELQESPSRLFIAERLAGLAGREHILFDLERYRTLYFKDVHTYSQEQFNTYLRNKGLL